MAWSDDHGDVQGMTYIVGRPFTSEDGEHNPGEECPNAPTFPLLESLVSSGYLYRVYEGNGYDRLPPHVFSAVQTHQEAQAKVEGDASRTEIQNDWNRPTAVKEAERQAEVDSKTHHLARDYAEKAHVKAGYTHNETLLKKEAEADLEQEKVALHNEPKRQTAKKAAKKA